MITINNVLFTRESLVDWVSTLNNDEVRVLVERCDIDELWAIANEEWIVRTFVFDDNPIELN